MSAYKYPSIFSRQMKAIVYLSNFLFVDKYILDIISSIIIIFF